MESESVLHLQLTFGKLSAIERKTKIDMRINGANTIAKWSNELQVDQKIEKWWWKIESQAICIVIS